MDRIRISDRFSLLSLLPWLLLALAIEQGPALSFYPDTNFSQQTELVEQAASDVDYRLQLEEDQEWDFGSQTYTGVPLLACFPHATNLLSLDSSSSFIHLQYRNLLISWIQSRSLPYQLS
ncbi:MAG: hypothetical protein F6K19_04775 [Cyanothece sp. SIO1E1]|nr:hypothetical protein [Cyanothece sp. SIO1E1]